MELTLLLDIINEEEYEIEEIRTHAKELIEDYWTRILSQNL